MTLRKHRFERRSTSFAVRSGRRRPRRGGRFQVERLEERTLLDGDFGLAFRIGANHGADSAEAVATDAAGNMYITGFFAGLMDFDPGPGTTVLGSIELDAFVAKYTAAGTLVWARQLGAGPLDAFGTDISVDGAGNVIVVGSFDGTADLDPGPGTAEFTSQGERDIFISKLDSNGNLVFARQLGGIGSDEAEGVAVDTAGNVYVTGTFENAVDFDPGAGVNSLTSFGAADIFVLKLDSGGDFVFARQLGGAAFDQVFDAAVDGATNVYTTGSFAGTVDFDPGPGTSNVTSVGNGDVFISKLDSAGNFGFVRRFGSTANEQGLAIAVDGSSNVYTAGTFESTVDFDPGAGTSTLTTFGVARHFPLQAQCHRRLCLRPPDGRHRLRPTQRDRGGYLGQRGNDRRLRQPDGRFRPWGGDVQPHQRFDVWIR
jgi:hypothetical protein